MRFKVSMINDLGNYHKDNIIANNEKESKMNVKKFNPKSRVLKVKWVYK